MAMQEDGKASIKIEFRNDDNVAIGAAVFVLGIADTATMLAAVNQVEERWKAEMAAATGVPSPALPPAQTERTGPSAGMTLAMAREWLQARATSPGLGAGHAQTLLERLAQLETMVLTMKEGQ